MLKLKFNGQGSGVIIVVVQVRAVKLSVAAVEFWSFCLVNWSGMNLQKSWFFFAVFP
jgi:hypothetical protein